MQTFADVVNEFKDGLNAIKIENPFRPKGFATLNLNLQKLKELNFYYAKRCN